MDQVMNTSPASRPTAVTTREPRQLSELTVSPHRVSVLVDGEPIEAVRVPMGTELVWRIKLEDRLSKESFADADQAVQWMATDMTLPSEAGAPKPDPSTCWVVSNTPEPERPDPAWQPLDWQPRSKPAPLPTDPRWVAIELRRQQGQPSASPVMAFAKAAALLGFGHRRAA
jgi:hypothetical protein